MDGNATFDAYREQARYRDRQPATAAAGKSGVQWPDPQPLTARMESEPYPPDALSEAIRAAVGEVQGFTKAPVSLVASSALAALSLAAQAYVDVKRADRLTGPAGLFLLTIADSGERKTTCDGYFSSAVREYEQEQAELGEPEQKRYQADKSAWEAKRAGLADAIKQAAKGGKDTGASEASLRDLEKHKPEPPRIPRMIYGDATPEALTWSLAHSWPSGGVLSSEAGAIFGSHGMGRESIMRNLAILNELWDGKTLSFDRRKEGGSFSVRGARLTVALQVQEATLRSFFDRSGGLARGTGFLARFLVAWPESTQGFRPFTEPPEHWPALAEFHRRIAAILESPAPMDAGGALSPVLLSLAPDAKAAWVAFHDAIEGELRTGGELYDVRDVASKTADNAARLAALFHVFSSTNSNRSNAITLEAFEGASRIAAWHLSEARRFFGEFALPEELADAARLDAWLLGYCRRERKSAVPKNHVRQYGPLRDTGRLDAALSELDGLARVRLAKEGKATMVQVHPALMAEGGAP